MGGWLAFDGAHALATGDYVTPDSGEHAGQLGPWSHLFEAVGVDPRSTAVQTLHLVLGLVWLVVMAGWAARRPWAWRGMLLCAIAGLWYLPFGTLLCLVQIGLLFRARPRQPRS